MITSEIQRTLRLLRSFTGYAVSIYHGRLHVAVAEQHLDRVDVKICLQQVCRKGVAEGVTGDPLREFRQPDGLVQSLLDV